MALAKKRASCFYSLPLLSFIFLHAHSLNYAPLRREGSDWLAEAVSQVGPGTETRHARRWPVGTLQGACEGFPGWRGSRHREGGGGIA